MPVFGGYETVGQLSPTPFGSVYKAKKTGGASAEFIIKTFSPLGVDARELKRHPDVKRFLGSAELQKQVAASSQRWAPIHEMGISQEGAYYVSTLYPTSASRLIKGKAKLSGDDFYELSAAVLAGLVELRQCCRRSHGNLTASTILLPRMDASGYGLAVLAEPLSVDSTKSASEQGDLAALGRVLYELVMYKAYNVTGAWPIPETPDWARLGKRAKEWRAFCNKLLSTEAADAMTLEGAAAELEKLKPKKALVPMWAIAAAVVVLLIGGGIFAYLKTRPDPNFQEKWTSYTEAYNGWFHIFAMDEWQRTLAADYPKLIAKAKENPRLTLHELNSASDDSPPATREGQLMTARAIDVATTIQVDLLHIIDPKTQIPGGLDKSAVPDRLRERIGSLAAAYTQRQWTGPAEALKGQLDDFNKSDPTDKRYFPKLGGLLMSLAQVNRIEAAWKPIEERAGAIASGGDPILTHLPELLSRKAGAQGRVSIDELEKNVRELGAELNNDGEWQSFFAFVQKDWPDITKDAKSLNDFRNGSELYKRFAREKPQLEKIHLQTWMKEAGDYTSLTEANPAADPKLAVELKSLKDQLADLTPEAAQVGEADIKQQLERLAKALETVSTKLGGIQGKRWTKGNRSEIETGATEVASRLGELQLDVNRAKDDLRRMKVAGAEEMISQIAHMQFTPPLDAKWKELMQQKWGWSNPAKLSQDLQQLTARQALKKSTDAAASALRKIETSLPERLNLGAQTRNRKWGPELVKLIAAMENKERYKSMEAEARLIKFDQLAGGAPPVDPKHEGYVEWCKRATDFVVSVAELEDRLDAGYGLVLASGEKTSAAEGAFGKCSADTEFWPDVKSALEPVLGRFRELQKLKSESKTATLASIIKNSQDSAMVVDAWRRLGQLESWPRTAQDLESEKSARKYIPEVIKVRSQYSPKAMEYGNQRTSELEKEFTQQWPDRWRKFAGARRGSQNELEKDLALALNSAKEFGVADWRELQPPLPAEVRWNIFVLQSKALLENLPPKMEDRDAQAKARQVIELLPPGNDAGATVADLRAKLTKLADAQGGAAVVEIDAGPASKEAQKLVRWEKSEENGVLTFTWKEKGHQISFIRCNGAKLADGGNAPPYYLSTTEVTLALFAEVMNALGPQGTADALGLPLSGDAFKPIKGPQLWRRSGGGGIEPAATWLRSHSMSFPDYPDSLPGGFDKDHQPAPGQQNRVRERMPMQYVPPAAALYIAAQLGCRFPTYSEWKVAASAQGINPAEWPNLRDATWAMEFNHIMSIHGRVGNQAQFPDSGAMKTTVNVDSEDKARLWTASTLASAGLGAIPAGFNDHYLWMRPVGDGKSFSDLYGNVAEMVFDDPERFQKLTDKSLAGIGQFLDQRAAQLFVVGGSFQSAPELGVDRQQLVDLQNGYADMGFRLAFVAAPAAIVDQLRDLMKKAEYAGVSGPTTAPAN